MAGQGAGPVKMQGSGPSRARGPVKMQGSGHPPRDGPGRSARRARKNVGIWALPCAGTRKNAGTRTRRVSGSSCTGAWPAWWRRPGHSETSTGRLLGRPLQREVHAARATAGRARLSAHGRARGLVKMYGSGHAPDLENVGIWAFPCAGTRNNARIRAALSGHPRAQGLVKIDGSGHPL